RLELEVPMELRVPVRSHVRDVDVPDASLGLRMHALAVGLDPAAIAQRGFVAPRLDHDPSDLHRILRPVWTGAVAGHFQLHFVSREMDEPLGGRRVRTDRLAAEREAAITRLDVDARRLERRGALR